MAFWNVRVEEMIKGASGAVDGIFDDEPMCMHTTVSVSWQAVKNGSQKRSLSWIEGSPSGCGFSGKVTAWDPLAAQRRTSAAASSASHRGTIVSGINRPLPAPADHSSIIQSLYAWTQSSARSLSARS